MSGNGCGQSHREGTKATGGVVQNRSGSLISMVCICGGLLGWLTIEVLVISSLTDCASDPQTHGYWHLRRIVLATRKPVCEARDNVSNGDYRFLALGYCGDIYQPFDFEGKPHWQHYCGKVGIRDFRVEADADSRNPAEQQFHSAARRFAINYNNELVRLLAEMESTSPNLLDSLPRHSGTRYLTSQ